MFGCDSDDRITEDGDSGRFKKARERLVDSLAAADRIERSATIEALRSGPAVGTTRP
ncbi:hypothetical protein [Natronomonas sp. LN261]|jgi:hypothetical protein|uniref:hypothetical protein n=1 Tax=Natronomonas sp. LN261 TaxID=2750669 RepID=UPI0015EE9915|nr:hypothetical protein [Natronomonas sp. LN261]